MAYRLSPLSLAHVPRVKSITGRRNLFQRALALECVALILDHACGSRQDPFFDGATCRVFFAYHTRERTRSSEWRRLF